MLDTHSLNIVVQAAAECCKFFFTFLVELYAYFNIIASTKRFKVMTDSLKKAEIGKPILVPQRTTTTRWSRRADATKALLRGYKEIKNALF